SPTTLNRYGVISEECAAEMAKNICSVMESDIGISFTGVAGPSSLEGHPVGTVFISIYSISGEFVVKKYFFHGNRDAIRHRATVKGFEILYNFLKNNKST